MSNATWNLLRSIISLRLLLLVSITFSGAMFGFFFAWICSTMWGLDRVDPNIAISAMQAMNASVRNWVFAPVFFGTPLLLIVVALTGWIFNERRLATCLAMAGIIYLLGVMVPTMTVNVPLNEVLSAVETPLDLAEANRIWWNYSDPWQFWNVIRAVFAGIVLALIGWGTLNTRFGSMKRKI